ncbi:flagellar hook-basal body complex protein [Desulfospira joergensenii]|uniref:flagellar hook-basal body complex protein n=1 Tax=Desulfospira joergensenii TaxID=53329 RepID=UPI0003B71B3C|nr:flagellar hook-basal body complex protein [Desulfospira joergensenii]
MSLSSSLFTGTSGLKNMGNALQVVGNNISNLNTIGFKRGRATFADTLYESVATQGGSDQMGRGMAVGDVSQNFSDGSFESTGNATDISIGGSGFFIMRQANSENTFYTRAGNFFFNKEGQLVNPEGYVVQGWNLDEETGEDVGAITDLVLSAFSSPPKKSTRVTAITNLDADSNSNAPVLSNSWNAGSEIYMNSTQYEHQCVIKAYDALGSTHDITIYYDKKSGTEWEYVITCDPEEDNRNLVQGTDAKGLLARGTITFSQSSGEVLDITMSEFTGRLGNFQAIGVNTVDDVEYNILNYEELALDGYGFAFEFDGATWDFVDVDNNGIISADEKPDNYANATIVYSDNQEIRLVLNQTDPTQTDPDLIIKLDEPALATDTIGFDINNKNDLHKQDVNVKSFFGDKVNSDNRTLEINDPSVMTRDSSGLGIVWNPNVNGTGEGQWYWSNPEVAYSAGTLVSGISITGTAGTLATTASTTVINNPADLSMYAENIKLRWDSGTWDWNDAIKIYDFTNDFSGLSNSQNTPDLTIVTQGAEGAIATDTALPNTPELHWLAATQEWSLTTAAVAVTSAQVGNTFIAIDPAASNSTDVVFDIWYASSADASTVKYTFGTALTNANNETIAFTMDPTPPEEYAAAVLSTAGTIPTQGFGIDFNGNGSKDITFSPTAGGGTMTPPDVYTFVFDTDPDVPPAEYANATLKGDREEAVIDLDGSGNDSDNDDIRWVFDDPLDLGGGTRPWVDRNEIDFDILGSTAWTEIDKSEITDTGYYAFTADFLGGEYGSTETKLELDMGSVYKDNNFVNGSQATTQYSRASYTRFQDADGYSAGDLDGVDVSSDGVMTGIYSNGELIPLFRIGLAKFLNNYGLNSEGGNLFSETRESGGAITNRPGENGLGTLAPNSLEMSNVDISEEFVSMITNQRGFQANSKTITTVDDMMQTVIQMKR